MGKAGKKFPAQGQKLGKDFFTGEEESAITDQEDTKPTLDSCRVYGGKILFTLGQKKPTEKELACTGDVKASAPKTTTPEVDWDCKEEGKGERPVVLKALNGKKFTDGEATELANFKMPGTNGAGDVAV